MAKQSRKVIPKKQSSFPIWLPLIIVAGVALVVVALVNGNPSASTAQPTPVVTGASALAVDKDKVDLGNVPLGQTVNVSFEVRNVGDAPLRFKEKPYIEVAAGC